nr:unnamed protein product [Callosobruchus chinensis]
MFHHRYPQVPTKVKTDVQKSAIENLPVGVIEMRLIFGMIARPSQKYANEKIYLITNIHPAKFRHKKAFHGRYGISIRRKLNRKLSTEETEAAENKK